MARTKDGVRVYSCRRYSSESRKGLYAFPTRDIMRDILPPHTEHDPCVAGRPFFKVTNSASRISLIALHFRQ